MVALLPLLTRPAAAQARDDYHFRTEVSEFDEHLPFPPEAVWVATAQVFAYLAFPMSTLSDSAGRVYLTRFLDLQGPLFGRPPGDYFDCPQYVFGLGNLNNTGLFTFAVRSSVMPDGKSGTLLRTQTDVRVRRRMWTATPVDCSSNGVFEKELARLVAQRLRELAAHPAPPPPGASP